MQNQYNQQRFLPNSRNSGGRAQINQLRKNHIIALVNSQAAIDTRKPPKPHVDQNIPYSSKNKGPKGFIPDEIQETYKRVKAVKHGYSDNKEPVSNKLKKSLSRKHSVQQEIVNRGHQNNVNSLIRNILRIQDKSNSRVKSMLDRSKIYKKQEEIKSARRKNYQEWDSRSSHPLEAEWKQSINQFKNIIEIRSVRPKSAKSKKSTQGHTNTLTNMLSMDTSEIINFSKFSHIAPSYYISDEPLQKAQDQFALDYLVNEGNQNKGSQNQNYQQNNQNQLQQLDIPLVVTNQEKDYEAHLIDQYDQEQFEMKNENPRQNLKNDTIVKDQVLKEAVTELDGYELYDKNRKSYRNIKIPLIPPTDNQRTIKKQIMLTIMDYKVVLEYILITFIDILKRHDLSNWKQLCLEKSMDESRSHYEYLL